MIYYKYSKYLKGVLNMNKLEMNLNELEVLKNDLVNSIELQIDKYKELLKVDFSDIEEADDKFQDTKNEISDIEKDIKADLNVLEENILRKTDGIIWEAIKERLKATN